MSRYFIIYFHILLIFSCSIDLPPDGELITWTTTFEIPLIQNSITIESLADDSLITSESLDKYFDNESSLDSIFVYNKNITIDKVEVGNRLNIDSFSSTFSQNIEDVTISSIEKSIVSTIGSVELNDISPSQTDPYIFSDIYPEISNTPNGESIAIPAFEIAPIFQKFYI